MLYFQLVKELRKRFLNYFIKSELKERHGPLTNFFCYRMVAFFIGVKNQC